MSKSLLFGVMKATRLMMLAAGIIGSTTVLANEVSGSVKIISLTNWVGTIGSPNEKLYVKTDETQLTNPANCSRTDVYYLDAASKISRSMLLTAYTAKTNTILNIYGGGCSSDNRPIIVMVSLVQ